MCIYGQLHSTMKLLLPVVLVDHVCLFISSAWERITEVWLGVLRCMSALLPGLGKTRSCCSVASLQRAFCSSTCHRSPGRALPPEIIFSGSDEKKESIHWIQASLRGKSWAQSLKSKSSYRGEKQHCVSSQYSMALGNATVLSAAEVSASWALLFWLGKELSGFFKLMIDRYTDTWIRRLIHRW